MASTTRNLVVLFADISGSTKLYEFLGNVDALATIDRCLAIVKRVCVDFGGRVVKTIGDEVLAVFPAADAAAQAAIEVQLRISKQRTPRDTPVLMHIGFHSGPTIEDEGDVFGDAVNVAARLTARPGFAYAARQGAGRRHVRADLGGVGRRADLDVAPGRRRAGQSH